jgi:hypothetical protein
MKFIKSILYLTYKYIVKMNKKSTILNIVRKTFFLKLINKIIFIKKMLIFSNKNV